jgi:hypothetical protein
VVARWGTAVLAGLVPALLAFRSGGYFPSEWGLVLLPLALVAIVCAILGDRLAAGRLELVLVGALAALAGWSALSAAWAPGPDGAVLAAERILVYTGGVAAVVLAVSRERVPWLLGGLAGGIGAVALWALETRLVQGDMGSAADVVTATRLARPIGYANALGALCAIGLLLALGLALWAGASSARAVAAALLVPFAAALALTLSRGSDLALLAGLVVLVAVERRSAARVAVLLLPVVAAGALAAHSRLTAAGLSQADARGAGQRLLGELVLLAGLAVAAARWGHVLADPLARHIRIVALAGAALVVVALVAAGPLRLVHRAEHRIEAAPPATGADLNRRVLSVSSNGRTAYWRVAWRMVERDPLLGAGGGSFERWWLQERPVANAARNAHDLYLETLAELGPVGLALLLVALGTPLWAARRAPGPWGATALAAYVAFLVHALLDWDWQIPAVTLPALACGAAVVVLARRAEPVPFGAGRRAAILVPGAVLLVAALVMHVGNRAADASEQAIARGDDGAARAQARRARTWMPWAALPWQLTGEAELATHRDRAARAALHRALSRDSQDWSVWYDLATVTTGAEHRDALRRARALDPLAPELQGLR